MMTIMKANTNAELTVYTRYSSKHLKYGHPCIFLFKDNSSNIVHQFNGIHPLKILTIQGIQH